MTHAPDASSREGFTLVEVLVAIVVLSVGVIALLGSSAMVTRMIGSGRHSTEAVQTATRRLERLRALGCTSGQFASGSASGVIDETWTVTINGATADVSVTVSYPTPRGTRSSTFQTVIAC